MTPQRIARLRQVLAQRQPDLTVVMDNVHKKHNFSAIVRSCDAVGVLEVHGVWPSPTLRPHAGVSGGVGRWVRVITHRDMAGALARLRADGHQIVAAHRGERATDFRRVDYVRPTAIVLGAELDGVGAHAREHADVHAAIPMHGMVESVNVSVAAALFLFEAQAQRRTAGLYARCRLDAPRHAELLFEWAHPAVAAYCRRHALPYPAMAEDGTIDPDFRAAARAAPPGTGR